MKENKSKTEELQVSEIIEILQMYSGYVDRSRTDKALHEDNFPDVAEKILKSIK